MRMKFCVFTTDGPNREDGNVYYAWYKLVSTDNPNLTFSESIFTHTSVFSMTSDEIVQEMKNLGYDVVDLYQPDDIKIFTVQYDREDEEDEEGVENE